MKAVSLSGIILTFNEERNLPACLEALAPICREIFVVDSGSSDGTRATAERFGAHFVTNSFEGHAKQWNWALRNLPLTGDWVIALDADQRLTPELQGEITQALPITPPEVAGYYLPRKNIFRGRWLRHGGYWPKYLLKLFRRGSASTDERELLDFRFYVKGKTSRLSHPLIEENLKEAEISFWLQKHIRFVERRAQEKSLRRKSPPMWEIQPRFWGSPDQRTLWLKERWYSLPPLVRPFPYFLYKYFFRLGFLDGREGALYIFLHSFWYELMIGVRLKELEGPRKRP